MTDTVVLVIFYSRGGATEALAHAAAVGAVQARALIRLRRVPDGDPEATMARFPEAREPLRRMHREYIAPREADVLGADALVLASRADVDATAPEWASCVQMIEALHVHGKLAGKAAAVVPNGASSASFEALLRGWGFAMPTADGAAADGTRAAVALGRAVVGATIR